jgi:hypothetical protein
MNGEFPRLVCPIPKELEEAHKRRIPPLRNDRKREMVWPWRDANGFLLKVTQRFPHSQKGKEVLPFTLWETGRDQYEWRQKDLATPRSLYGLERLVAHPDALVIVCEGEKACDEAEKVFPECVAVTSGSATSARNADWSPLRGRGVVIWPDHDEAGQRYGREVQECLPDFASSIASVQIPAEFPAKWDLADPSPPGWNATRLRELLESACRAQPQAPTAILPSLISLSALRIVSAGDVLNSPPKPREWLWQGYIPLGREGLVGGLSDVGKTAFHLQLAVAVATGRDLFGTPTRPVGEGVLFLTFEDDPCEDFRERLAWVKETYPDWGPADDASLERNLKLACPTWEADASIKSIRLEIEACFTEFQALGIRPALLILETLASITEGDGNSDESTRKVWEIARAMRTRFGVTVSLAHHHRKPTGEEAKDVLAQLEARQLRGTSNNEGSARWVIQLATIHFEKAEALGLDPIKAQRRGYVVLAASKIKADPPAPLVLERVDSDQPGRHSWARRMDGDRIMADLMKSKGLKEELGKQQKVGLAVLQLGDQATRESVLKKTDLSGRELDSAIYDLRKKLFLGKQRSPYLLTPTGLDWAHQIARTQVPGFPEMLDSMGLCSPYSGPTQVETQVPELEDGDNSHTQVPLGVGPELSCCDVGEV